MPQTVDMYSLPVTLIFSLAKGIEYAYLISFFVTYKYKWYTASIPLVLSVVISNAILLPCGPAGNISSMLIVIASDLIILRLTTCDSLLRQTAVVAASNILLALINGAFSLIVFNVYDLASGGKYGSSDRYEPVLPFVICVCCCIIVPLLLTPLLRRLNNLIPAFTGNTLRYLILLMSPIANILIYIKYLSLRSEAEPDKFIQTDIHSAPAVFLSLIMDISIIAAVIISDRADKLHEETRMDIIAKREYLASLPDSDDSDKLRRLRHDMANILLTARGLIAAGHEDEARRLLEAAQAGYEDAYGDPGTKNE